MDFLVAVATYLMSRTIYETRWEQTYTVSVEPPRPMEEPSNIPVVDVELPVRTKRDCGSRQRSGSKLCRPTRQSSFEESKECGRQNPARHSILRGT